MAKGDVDRGFRLDPVSAHDQLLEVTDADLALRDTELMDLRLTRASAHSDVDIGFLWEEILAGLDRDRLMHLRRAAQN